MCKNMWMGLFKNAVRVALEEVSGAAGNADQLENGNTLCCFPEFCIIEASQRRVDFEIQIVGTI